MPDSVENFDHIFYRDCLHFTVGHVDQWGEQGYLLFEGKVYSYEEDRKDQCGRTYAPTSIEEFLLSVERQNITVPNEFLEKLKEVER